MSNSPRQKKKRDIRDQYREILQMPDLTDSEIDEIRKPMILLAQTICEHVWGQRFY
jgi:hypothetical protein